MRPKLAIPIDFESTDAPVLACPVCGDAHVHPVGFECRSPGNARGHVRIDCEGISLNPATPPSGRGVMMTLRFICESGHGFDYEFQFHKGNTLVACQTCQLAEDVALRPQTIWRD